MFVHREKYTKPAPRGQSPLNFTGPSQAVIEEAAVQAGVLILIESEGHVCSGMLTINGSWPWQEPSTNGCDNVSTNGCGTTGGTNETSSAGN